MLRQVVPRLSGPYRQVCRGLRAAGTVNKAQPARSFGDRWLPIRRDFRRSWVDDFFNRCPYPKDVWHQLRRMEKEMIENKRGAGGPWGPRWAERFERGMENGFNQGKVLVVREAGQFKVQVDMGRCPAEAITVKTAGDKLVIQAETTRDSERILSKREFRVAIPKEVETETFESLITDDGVLTVSARMKEAPPPVEKVIEVKQEAKKVKDKVEDKGEEK